MKLIKRTAVRKEFQVGRSTASRSRLFAVVTSRIVELSDGRKNATTTIELCGGRIDKDDKLRWCGSVKEFKIHEEPVMGSAWDEQAYCLTWHNSAVDLMSNMTEGAVLKDITEYGDYY